MCGIVGIAALNGARPPNLEDVRRMCRVLEHRGPDDEGIEMRDGVALGNRRLAVIDVAGGRQPIGNTSNSVRVIQNGEIYNFRELRRWLERSGHRFHTDCDTEVLVHSYEEIGPEFLGRLNGMFALALHDSRNRKLILARDPLGIKPLYYCFIDDRYLVWGSEIKALLASRLLSRRLDIDSLGQFLSWEYVPGKRTLLNGVYALEPAEMLTIDLNTGASRKRFYWDIEPERSPIARKPADWEAEVDATIRRSVERQLVSDVPLGALFSGGVDSSLVVSSMGPAKVFTIGFDDASYNELGYAKRIADRLGVDQFSQILRPEIASLFDLLMGHLDDPIGDFSIFPTYLVSRLAREHVTVALSGDGGDELFGGYETYLAQRYDYWYQYLPTPIKQRWLPWLARHIRPKPAKKGSINKFKRFIEGTTFPKELNHARWRIFASDQLKKELLNPDAARQLVTPTGAHIDDLLQRAASLPTLERSLYTDMKSYLSDNCLLKMDRMSMATSLEVRVPLLDKELVELAFRIPQDLKISGWNTKAILKRVATRHIPREDVYRPKQGFSIPMKQWLKAEFRPILEDLLSPGRINEDGLFNWKCVERLKREHLQGQADHSHVLWSLTVFQAWKARWLDSRSSVFDF
jgi:asparagine synthase (glutamine-hydrolysing)